MWYLVSSHSRFISSYPFSFHCYVACFGSVDWLVHSTGLTYKRGIVLKKNIREEKKQNAVATLINQKCENTQMDSNFNFHQVSACR